jgi:hypothetical protein
MKAKQVKVSAAADKRKKLSAILELNGTMLRCPPSLFPPVCYQAETRQALKPSHTEIIRDSGMLVSTGFAVLFPSEKSGLIPNSNMA